MNKNMIALILGAGIALVVYSKIGKRIGYGNTKNVWFLVGGVFVLGYVLVLITLTWVIHVK